MGKVIAHIKGVNPFKFSTAKADKDGQLKIHVELDDKCTISEMLDMYGQCIFSFVKKETELFKKGDAVTALDGEFINRIGIVKYTRIDMFGETIVFVLFDSNGTTEAIRDNNLKKINF